MTTMPRRFASQGFTLVELLVVIAIIGLISAVALPVVVPALNERRVSEAARIIQAVLSGARDAAIRANAPRGIRLLPDPEFGLSPGQALAANRFVSIEPAPDYSEGVVDAVTDSSDVYYGSNDLRIKESISTTVGTATILDAPTGWKFNIRQGDKIRFNNSGAYYTIAGPIHQAATETTPGSMIVNNPERYICYTASPNPSTTLVNRIPEYLSLANGIDDDADGYIDESCDGIDNDNDGVVDPGFNGIDDDKNGKIDDVPEIIFNNYGEYETEVFLGVQANTPPSNSNYTITRRPVVSPSSAETTLPVGVVIDLTTWNAAASTNKTNFENGSTVAFLPERSRLPVDPFSGYVDILIDQTGRVVPPGAGSGGGAYYADSPLASVPFYHFWITEREGVVAPLWGIATSVTANTALGYNNILQPNPNAFATTSQSYFLPMPQGTANYTAPPSPTAPFLLGERRLVTLFTKTGQIVSNSIQSFDGHDTSAPFYDAQRGTKEPQ